MASLADRSVSYLHAYSTTSWTAPAVASILTGTYPSLHGGEHGAFRDGAILGQEVLQEALPLLPELLRKQGYRTFGITANEHLAAEFGFDRYACLGFSGAEALSAALSEWLPEIRSSIPYLLWLHVLDPHAPYTRREPWFSERFGAAVRPELEAVPRAPDYAKLGVEWGSEDLAYVQALYHSEVSYIDGVLRETLDAVAPGRADLVIVTSDHGEEFQEHGRFGHGQSLFEETVRVPLIIRHPGERFAGTRVEQPVSLVDLLRTILDILEIEPPERLQGRVLMPGPQAGPRRLYLELSRIRIDWAHGVVDGGWKLIDRRRPATSRLLYDLSSDPGERDDRADSEVARVKALLALAQRHREESLASRTAEPRHRSLSADQLEELRALGYVR